MKQTATILLLLMQSLEAASAGDGQHNSALERIQSDIEFFAADAQEGRGVETRGIQRAADRIVLRYETIGLKPVLDDGSWRQPFGIRVGSTDVGADTALSFRIPGEAALKLTTGNEFQPLRRGGTGSVESSLVFVGYGISDPESGYDDYAGLDVEGRTLVMIRRVPGQGDPESPFAGEDISHHAYVDTKLKLADEHKAAGVLFVNDPFTSPDAETEELVSPDGFGARGKGPPFLQVRQNVINRLLQQSPLTTDDGTELRSLAAVTRHIDQTMRPLSQPLTDWTVDLTVSFEGRSVEATNLIGMVEGQGPLQHETIIIGAHYDHIGRGEYGSRARKRRGEIHNGADDNASGTAAVLELADRIAAGPPPARRVVFVCFSGEERGLLGSRHYVRHPVVPLDDTVFMFNFDMIGSVRSNRVEVNGVGTAVEFLPLVQLADRNHDLDVSIVSNPFGGSDHLPFYRKGIPVMFCFSGMTDRYHTPDDDVEAINMEGVVSVVDLAEQIYRSVDALPQQPEFRKTPRGRIRMGVLGIRPDLSGQDASIGVRVLGTGAESPAAEAGIQVGDIIVQIADQKLADYADLNDYLRDTDGGEKVPVIVLRGDLRIALQVTLGEASR